VWHVMNTQSTHTQQRPKRRYVAGSSRGSHSAITLLAQVADKQRGDRIKARHEELHLTEPAVVELMEELAWKLPRTNSLHPETAAEKKGKERPIPPLTLRGFQSYKAGGGIAWEKAKLLAQVLQMDVRVMLHGESEKAETPDPFPPADPESGIAEVLAKLLAAVDKQNKLLDKQTEVLERIEKAIDREDDAAKTLRTEGQTWVARVEALARQGFADAPQTREEAQDIPGA
jgi:hypothetical protein